MLYDDIDTGRIREEVREEVEQMYFNGELTVTGRYSTKELRGPSPDKLATQKFYAEKMAELDDSEAKCEAKQRRARKMKAKMAQRGVVARPKTPVKVKHEKQAVVKPKMPVKVKLEKPVSIKKEELVAAPKKRFIILESSCDEDSSDYDSDMDNMTLAQLAGE